MHPQDGEQGLYLPQRLERETSRDYATRSLLWNIVNLRLPPGMQISENDMAAVLPMSRTPIREAFISLEKAGLLNIYPQRGSFVSLIHRDAVEEARFVRSVLEERLWREACGGLGDEALLALEENLRLQELLYAKGEWARVFEADNEFHRMLFEFCGKARTYRTLEHLLCHLDRVRSLSLYTVELGPKLQEHREVVRAIRENDPELAARLARSHANWIAGEWELLEEKNPGYFAER